MRNLLAGKCISRHIVVIDKLEPFFDQNMYFIDLYKHLWGIIFHEEMIENFLLSLNVRLQMPFVQEVRRETYF